MAAASTRRTLSVTMGAALVDTLGYRPLLIITVTALSIAAIPVLTHPASRRRCTRSRQLTGSHPRVADLTAEYRAPQDRRSRYRIVSTAQDSCRVTPHKHHEPTLIGMPISPTAASLR